MKKSRISIGLMSCLLSVGALAGCNKQLVSSKDGVIFTYNDQEITADDLLTKYYDDSTKYQSIYDTIYSLIVQNYFSKDEVVKYQGSEITLKAEDMNKQINQDAEYRVQSDERNAKSKAEENDTNPDDEWEAILESKGVADRDELLELYKKEERTKKFDENFYKYHMTEIKNGDTSVKRLGTDEQLWYGYFKDMVPYHISHILVEVSDSSGTNYANGTISKTDAENLAAVVDLLKEGNQSFGTIASSDYSGDDGSKAKYGDLGIMDYSESFVDEFKLGVYAYENFFGDNKKEVHESNINIPGIDKDESNPGQYIETGLAKTYNDLVAESYDFEITNSSVPTIKYSVFTELKKVADVEGDANGRTVLEDATFYPRNVIYNKYLNRHSFAFIEDDDTSSQKIYLDSQTTKMTGFVVYRNENGTNGKFEDKPILSVRVNGEWTPIIVTRGTSKQGLHFIVINRSPFAATVNGVSLDDYYTTFSPEQPGYPEVGNAKTFVNFSSTLPSDTKNAAKDLDNKFRTYDADRLNKYIFTKYYNHENIKFADDELGKKLIKWINASFDRKAEEKEEAWSKTWTNYIDTLRKQNSERTKLISQACRIGYAYGNRKVEDIETFTVKVSGNDVKLIDLMVDAMYEANEYKGTETDINAIKLALKGQILTTHYNEAVKTMSDLFKLEGALCNDGKTH